MGAEPTAILVLCGKSNVENELALSLKSNNALKLPDNNPVSIHLHSETGTLSYVCEGFRVDDYMDLLSTSQFGRLLIYSPRLGSTHDVVSHNFFELPIGAVCVADEQTKGRDWAKNVWESPKGCLLFSFTLQMEAGREVSLLQYVVGLAVTEAIKDLCQEKGIQHLDVKIKWPNYLYVDGIKVGGILCTSIYKSKKFNVSAGIGLNVSNEKPTTCLNAIVKKFTPFAFELLREDLMAAFFNKFENLYNVFLQQGFQSLKQLYYKTWLHSGQRVIVQDENDNQDQVVENVVTIQDIQHLDVKMKWTNDLYVDGIQVAGILCTSTYKSKKFTVSAGTGLNVSNEKPTTCLNAIVKKFNPLAFELLREDLMAAFFNKFENLYNVFMQQGFQSLEQPYYKTGLHSGQRVIVQDKNDNQDQVVENVVTIEGLTPSGYLLAISDDGQTCELLPIGDSLDFSKGLIRRKLA